MVAKPYDPTHTWKLLLDSPEQGLEPLRGPRDREGENDAVPPDEGDPVSQQGLEGLGQLCFLGRKKKIQPVLLRSRERCWQDHGTAMEGAGGSRSFLACSRDGKTPNAFGNVPLEGLN